MKNAQAARRAFEAWIHAVDHTTMPDTNTSHRKVAMNYDYLVLTGNGSSADL